MNWRANLGKCFLAVVLSLPCPMAAVLGDLAVHSTGISRMLWGLTWSLVCSLAVDGEDQGSL